MAIRAAEGCLEIGRTPPLSLDRQAPNFTSGTAAMPFRRTTGARPENGLRAAADGSHLLTVAQAAEACQVSQRQIRRMIRDGRIQVRRFGRSVRIRPADLGL